MSAIDRLRAALRRDRARAAWDDEADATADAVASLAVAWDAAPDDPRASASRAAVLGAFAATSAAAPADEGSLAHSTGATGRALPPAGAAPGYRRGGRRPAFVLVATGLLLAASLGTVAASAPGGPLYDLRVSSEELFLPAAAVDRIEAQVARLDGRLAEASGAAARGDGEAVRASLAAYARIADAAAASPPDDPGVAAAMALRVRAQVGDLAELVIEPASEPERARAETAARALLGALGDTWPAPDPGAGPLATPSQGGATGNPGAPGGSGGPGEPGGPGASGGAGPGGPGGPTSSPPRRPVPTASATPRTTTGPGPAATPRRSPEPSPSGGGGSGPGGPGGGSDRTPRPSGGGSGGGSGGAPGGS